MSENHGDLDPELEKELREWLPSIGNRLFVETMDAAMLDPLGFSVPGEQRSPIGRWALYADGFLHAADRIVDGWAGQPWEDELIYPVLSLYRQHLELLLKLVIRSAPGFTDDVKDRLYKTHELEKLWDKLEEVYPESQAGRPGHVPKHAANLSKSSQNTTRSLLRRATPSTSKISKP